MRKSDKLKNIEEANKRLLGEDFEWAGDVPSDEKYKMKSSSKSPQYDHGKRSGRAVRIRAGCCGC